MAISTALYSSRTEEWATPQDLFDQLNAEFGFTLDTAACAENAKCPRFYTKEDDGLSKPWEGTVWCNPPYGKTIGLWMKKGYESSLAGATVVMLVHSRTDTRWFHDWVYHKAELRFLRGRLKFGGSKHPAPFPSMLVVYRPPTEASALSQQADLVDC